MIGDRRSVRRETAIVALVAISAWSIGACSPRSVPLKERIAHCQHAWQSLYNKEQDNYVALQSQWSREETECKGTGVYEYYRAVLLESLGDLHGASQYLRSVMKQKLPNERVLYVHYLAIQFSQALQDGGDTKKLRAINAKVEYAARKRPDDPFVLAEQARELDALREYSRAMESAKKASDLDPGNWAARQWLVMAASQVHRCRVAQPYIVPAIKAHQVLLRERDFMLAAASCYLEIGAAPTARNVLLSLSHRNSAVVQDPVFQRLWAQADMAVKEQHSAMPNSTN